MGDTIFKLNNQTIRCKCGDNVSYWPIRLNGKQYYYCTCKSCGLTFTADEQGQNRPDIISPYELIKNYIVFSNSLSLSDEKKDLIGFFNKFGDYATVANKDPIIYYLKILFLTKNFCTTKEFFSLLTKEQLDDIRRAKDYADANSQNVLEQDLELMIVLKKQYEDWENRFNAWETSEEQKKKRKKKVLFWSIFSIIILMILGLGIYFAVTPKIMTDKASGVTVYFKSGFDRDKEIKVEDVTEKEAANINELLIKTDNNVTEYIAYDISIMKDGEIFGEYNKNATVVLPIPENYSKDVDNLAVFYADTAKNVLKEREITKVNVDTKTVEFKVEHFSTYILAQKPYVVKFYINIEDEELYYDKQLIFKGEKAVEPENPERTGYIFSGWYFEDNTEEIKWIFDKRIKSDIVLKAHWEPIVYTVIFLKENGEELGSTTYTLEVNEITDLVVPDKIGYTGKWQAHSIDRANPQNLTVSPEYEINQYTISFMDENKVFFKIVQNFETDIVPPQAPEKVGYIFQGWDKTIPSKMPAENITISANWEAKQINVSYNLNTTSSSSEQDSGKSYSGATWKNQGSDDKITYDLTGTYLDIPQASYYNFDGWYTAQTGGTKVADSTGKVVYAKFTANTTLYAHWTKEYSGYKYIATSSEFTNAVGQNLSGKYLLISNIDLEKITPFGSYSWSHSQTSDSPGSPFKGVLNGGGNTITYSVSIGSLSESKDYGFGLFGSADGATFTNLRVKATIKNSTTNPNSYETCVGGIVGLAKNCKFTDCSVSGIVENWDTDSTYYTFLVGMERVGATYAGGLAGDARSCTFTNCSNAATVKGRGFACYNGGIAGNAYNCSFSGCKNAGNVSAEHGDWIWGHHASGGLYGKDTDPYKKPDGNKI